MKKIISLMLIVSSAFAAADYLHIIKKQKYEVKLVTGQEVEVPVDPEVPELPELPEFTSTFSFEEISQKKNGNNSLNVDSNDTHIAISANGGAYVYKFDGMNPYEEYKLMPSQATGNQFGVGLAMDGDTIVVGANTDDTGGSNHGAAYVFKYDGTDWNQQAILIPSNPDGIMSSARVAIDGNRIITSSSRAIFVWKYDGSNWVEEAKLTSASLIPGVYISFGQSLAINGNTILIGAEGDDELALNSGAVFVFRHDGTNWVESEKITAGDAQAYRGFGARISMDGNKAVIGGRGNVGEVYVFEDNGTNLIQEQKLLSSDGESQSYASSLTIEGNVVVVGDYRAIDGKIGAAYVFNFDGSNWTEDQRLTSYNTDKDQYFGNGVNVFGNDIVIGSKGMFHVFSEPLDSDSDGISDGVENLSGFDPFDAGSRPALLDTDSDGIIDTIDIDIDNDGFTNEKEINKGTDPLDPNSFPAEKLCGDGQGPGDGSGPC